MSVVTKDMSIVSHSKNHLILVKFVESCYNPWICYSFYRYHYNVTDGRLSQHIDKGNQDGLFISCVASFENLWALVMDAGTGFTSQVYELSSSFLHKV